MKYSTEITTRSYTGCTDITVGEWDNQRKAEAFVDAWIKDAIVIKAEVFSGRAVTHAAKKSAEDEKMASDFRYFEKIHAES